MPVETRSLHKKLAQVAYEAERIPKNGRYTGPGAFSFVQAGDAADVIRKALAEKSVTMIPTNIELIGETEHPTKSGGTMTTMTVRTTWTLTDGDSGETTTIMSLGSGADSGDKAAPKAQTNAMKYALLMGFLLSTGDDPELSDSSDRGRRGMVDQRPVGTHDAPPDRPELERHAEGLVGTATVGRPPCDMQLRQTPDGPAWGFKLKAGNKGYQALARDDLAEALAMLPDLSGQIVTVGGRIEMVPWEKDGKAMPPFARIAIERVSTPDFTLPAEEAATAPLFPDEDLSDLI